MPGTIAPEQPRYEDLAAILEQPLLAPALSESDVAAACEGARGLGIAAVLVRPCDLDSAVNWLRGSAVALAAAVDVPGGSSTTSSKLFAVRDALRRGAREVDTVMNSGKLVSRQFQYLETELLQMADACHAAGALLKVRLEGEHLNEELKMVACRIARRAGADYIAASTLEDLALLKTYAKDKLRLKCTSPVTTVESALVFRDAGCSRIERDDTAALLESWKQRLAAAQCEQGAPAQV